MLRRSGSIERLAGLHHAELAFAAPLSPSVLPRPDFHRVVMVATWDSDQAVDRFLSSQLAEEMAWDWGVRLAPVRAHGEWPGLPSDVDRSRHVRCHGPVAVLTLGRLRLRRAAAFFRASARAEAQILRTPGLIWATGIGRPPFVGTCSLWRDSHPLEQFAYGDRSSGHGQAISADQRAPFHHVSAFVRFRPYGSVGALGGSNPLDAHWADDATAGIAR